MAFTYLLLLKFLLDILISICLFLVDSVSTSCFCTDEALLMIGTTYCTITSDYKNVNQK